MNLAYKILLVSVVDDLGLLLYPCTYGTLINHAKYVSERKYARI